MRSPGQKSKDERAPIPLVAFEHYMLADDSDPSFPMTFWLRVNVDGVPDKAKLETAFDWSLSRHPLTTRLIRGDVRGPTKKLQWIVPENTNGPLPLFWSRMGEELPFPQGRRGIDLQRESGIRLFVQTSSDGSEFLLQCHHAVLDGMGAVQLVEDILAQYGGTPERARNIDASLLAQRGTFHLSTRHRLMRIGRDLARILRFLHGKPAQLVDPGSIADTSTISYPASCQLALSPDAINELQRDARNHGGTLNDALLARLFVGIWRWRRESPESRTVRIAMPLNMRQDHDRAMPAANIVSMCFLDRRPPLTVPSADLITSIIQETATIKKYGMGYAMISALRAAGCLPRGMSYLTRSRHPDHCHTTAVLSNLGRPLATSLLARDQCGCIRADNLRLMSLELLPPIRQGTAAAFGVATEAQKTMITLHYDPAALSERRAIELLNSLQ